MVKIYIDTNVLRYFGRAFVTCSLSNAILVQLLLSPLSLLELLSQLGTDQAEEAFASVRALPRVHNPGATGILPWADDFFRISLFELPPGEDTMTPALNGAVNRVLNAADAAELKTEGEEMGAYLDHGKNEAATHLKVLLKSSRRAVRSTTTNSRPAPSKSSDRKPADSAAQAIAASSTMSVQLWPRLGRRKLRLMPFRQVKFEIGQRRCPSRRSTGRSHSSSIRESSMARRSASLSRRYSA